LPETGSLETNTGLALNSQINVTGKTIHLDRGSTIQTTGGAVTLRAGKYNFVGGTNPVSRFIDPEDKSIWKPIL